MGIKNFMFLHIVNSSSTWHPCNLATGLSAGSIVKHLAVEETWQLNCSKSDWREHVLLAETSQLMIPETFCLRKVQRVKVKVHLNEGLYCNPNNLPGTTQSGESAGTAQTRLGFLGAQLISVDDPKQFSCGTHLLSS